MNQSAGDRYVKLDCIVVDARYMKTRGNKQRKDAASEKLTKKPDKISHLRTASNLLY